MAAILPLTQMTANRKDSTLTIKVHTQVIGRFLWLKAASGELSGSGMFLCQFMKAAAIDGERIYIEPHPDDEVVLDPEPLPADHPCCMVVLDLAVGDEEITVQGEREEDKFAIRQFITNSREHKAKLCTHYDGTKHGGGAYYIIQSL